MQYYGHRHITLGQLALHTRFTSEHRPPTITITNSRPPRVLETGSQCPGTGGMDPSKCYCHPHPGPIDYRRESTASLPAPQVSGTAFELAEQLRSWLSRKIRVCWWEWCYLRRWFDLEAVVACWLCVGCGWVWRSCCCRDPDSRHYC